MGDLRKLFAVDEKKEQEGIWEDVGDGVRVLVARIGNPLYTKEVTKLMRPYRRGIRRGSVQDDVIEAAITKAMAKTILLGWEGLEIDGVPIEFSPEKAQEILFEFKEFRDLISDIANELDAFKTGEDEEAEKN